MRKLTLIACGILELKGTIRGGSFLSCLNNSSQILDSLHFKISF